MTAGAAPSADPVVVIVGASSGIGRASAHRFADRGANLVLASRSEPRLQRVAMECRRRGAADALVVPTDVADDDAVQRLVQRTLEAHERVDVVVFSAAVMAYGRIEDVPSAVFARVIGTAVGGTASVARSVMPVFRRQGAGTMVVVTSLLASIPVPKMGVYIASKWGQLALARVLQLETRDDDDINVCTVSPGAVDTPVYRTAANYVGRFGRPPPPVSSADRVARAVLACADRPRRNMSVGPTNLPITLGFRLLPALYDAMVTPLFELAGLSRETTPATEGNVFDPDGHSGEATAGSLGSDQPTASAPRAR